MLKPNCHPKAVLQSKPDKVLAFWGCPDLPNQRAHARIDEPSKLQGICRGTRVGAVQGELPPNSVTRTLLGENRAELLPEVVELLDVLHGKATSDVNPVNPSINFEGLPHRFIILG